MKSNSKKYSYKGLTLYEFCKNNPELKYDTLRRYIYRQKLKNPDQTDEEIIQKYMDKLHKGIYRYYYVGIPLKQYCEENNVSYQNILSYIQYHKNEEKFSNLNDDEFIEAIMMQYQPFEPKYLYNGILLTEYCKENNIPYTSIVSFVNRKLISGCDKDINDLIIEGIDLINKNGIIYYYNGIPLIDYCKNNDINYNSIRGAILKRKINSDKPLQEIVNECVQAYKKISIKYMYDGMTLRKYCIDNGISYKAIINKYLSEYRDCEDTDYAIKQIINDYLENPPVTTKYYFENQSLASFCNKEGYSYSNILRRIKTLQSNQDIDDTKIVELAVKKYEDRLEINKINKLFKDLEIGEIQDLKQLKELCDFLKIDFCNVNYLISMDFSYSQAINLIWYFSDAKDSNDYKLITDKKLSNLFLLVKNLKSNCDIENIELYDLIGIYKSKLYDTRNEIVMKQRMYLYHTIHSLCRDYNIDLKKDNFEDFESEIKLYLIAVIDRINLNVYGQIIKYMDLTVKGCFRTYLKQYKKQSNNLSIDAAKYDNSDKNYNETRLDYIESPDNTYEKIENTVFSENMMQLLSTLPPMELSFIMLRYQENYSYEALADYFNLTVSEVKQKEIEILSSLRNNQKVKIKKR